jgi:hypothetical protein
LKFINGKIDFKKEEDNFFYLLSLKAKSAIIKIVKNWRTNAPILTGMKIPGVFYIKC